VTKDPGLIDDGYWQGAPVGGMGAGTFSRSYRGDFSRWHIKAGVHKYETVYVNEFAMFQKSEGDSTGTARVLMTDHPRNGELASWAWDYPVGAGQYSALYPKSWYDYKWLPRISRRELRLRSTACGSLLGEPHQWRR
jgi:non-lysosomal glucosylceramidase